jgi:parvulin-like peptidyl-prolyl isomerase
MLAAALALAAVGCGGRTVSVPPSAVALVGDIVVTRAELEAQMASVRRVYAAEARPFPARESTGYRRLRQLAVAVLVDTARQRYTAARLGIEITPAQVDGRLRRYKLQQFGGDEERYRARLRQTGTTDAEIRTAIRRELLAAAIREDGRTVASPRVVYGKGFAPAAAG